MDVSRTELSWSGWGDPAQARPLPAAILGLLRDGLGVSRPNPVPTASEQVELEPIRLAPKIAAGLVALVGDPYARHDHEARLRHALGKSTLDL
ncbi:MAG: alkyldihydroxyacetonephosphate synthase, partial [Trebonia sp.]|nr:alkyldihydroxyacetonephosphate synthase [Trebonia sp.]